MPDLSSQKIDYVASARVFSGIYDNNVWGTGSGASSPEQTKQYMIFLSSFMNNNNIRSVVDVGCGDWQFSREIDWSNVTYNGFDVVDSVIKRNQDAYIRENIKFNTLIDIMQMPPADLIVCKDVLQHMPTADIIYYLNFFFDNYKFAIITNDSHATNKTADGDIEIGPEYLNADIDYGEWRMIQLGLPPFGVRNAVLLRWTIDGPTMSWTKDACLLLGRPTDLHASTAQDAAPRAGWRRFLGRLTAR